MSLARSGRLQDSRTGWSVTGRPACASCSWNPENEPTGFIYPTGIAHLPATPNYAAPGTAVKSEATAGQSQAPTSRPESPPPGSEPFHQSHGDDGGGGRRRGAEAATSATGTRQCSLSRGLSGGVTARSGVTGPTGSLQLGVQGLRHDCLSQAPCAGRCSHGFGGTAEAPVTRLS